MCPRVSITLIKIAANLKGFSLVWLLLERFLLSHIGLDAFSESFPAKRKGISGAFLWLFLEKLSNIKVLNIRQIGEKSNQVVWCVQKGVAHLRDKPISVANSLLPWIKKE